VVSVNLPDGSVEPAATSAPLSNKKEIEAPATGLPLYLTVP
jgi:hypothetical protein